MAGAKDPAYLGRFTGSKAADLYRGRFRLADAAAERARGRSRPDATAATTRCSRRRRSWSWKDGVRTSSICCPKARRHSRRFATTRMPPRPRAARRCSNARTPSAAAARALSTGGGGRQSLAMNLWPAAKITDKHNSPAYCALSQSSPSSGSRRSRFRPATRMWPCSRSRPRPTATARTSTGAPSSWSIRSKPRRWRRPWTRRPRMKWSPRSPPPGRVALYGILFDSSKADVKPESKDTMAEIGKLLAANKSLKLLVVGHTDNVGGFAAEPRPVEETRRRRGGATGEPVQGRREAPAGLRGRLREPGRVERRRSGSRQEPPRRAGRQQLIARLTTGAMRRDCPGARHVLDETSCPARAGRRMRIAPQIIRLIMRNVRAVVIA